MEVDKLAKYVEVMYGRLTTLYQGANAKAVSSNLLPTFLMELGNASEEMQIAVEELQKQNHELAAARLAAEAESQRYQELFEFLPDAYLATDTEGTIWEANRAAGSLFNLSPRFLIGKPLSVFVTSQELQPFLSKLLQLEHADPLTTVTELRVTLQRRGGEPFLAAMRVAKNHQAGKQVSLRWLLHDITARKQVEVEQERNCDRPFQERPLQTYSKDEIIPLEPHTIFYVFQGLVKLSAFCEDGEETLVGLVGVGQPFGINMTSLSTHEATALSDVKLTSISVAEIASSPADRQILLSQITQRHKQTELLLFIAGQRRLKDRLHYLLQFLKQEIGQPVENGTRLSVRLTHEDLANACHTTRVSVTRALGKLKQQGKITFDSKSHIVLIEQSN